MDARWREELEGLHARIAHRFGRAETRERVLLYLAGLAEGSGRRNGRRMAERMGEARSDGAQRLLNAARWDVDGVRDDLMAYVLDSLNDLRDCAFDSPRDPRGGLVLVEAGFRKRGARSAGVARQLNPSTGRVENCQVALFLAYASPCGRAFIDRELYLPEEWAGDAERRRAAGVPEEVGYATKEELARTMLERAFGAEDPAAWVAGGETYGDNARLRRWFEVRRQPYALVRRFRGPEDTAGGLPYRRWRETKKRSPTWAFLRRETGSWESGRMYKWGRVSQVEEATGSQTEWLVLRRWSSASKIELAFYRADSFGQTTWAELAGAAATHEAVEDDLERARVEVGLGKYEARGWEAWYRHVTLCLLAYAASQVARGVQARGGRARGDS